ncbi:glycosyltransferase family 4 protein [Rhodohalobacter sp. 8-1]|uniref:glycosyltransferase family 4 protein n=1 Tax=Rhodohalobacter sp. 8-1 TaxID=3131972 RepID=UPI0030EEB41E
MNKKKFLYLYSELADYFVACIRHLEKNFNVEIHLVRWPVNSEAPFQFEFPENVTVYERRRLSSSEMVDLAKKIDPDLIYCCGWMDKDYLRICKMFKNRIPVLGGMDNHWTGSFKQQIAKILSPFTIQKYFTHMFVAGAPQRVYAKKLGFNDTHILEGYYSADFYKFNKIYKHSKENKERQFPHKFLYVGRYIEKKGIKNLWKAFIELNNEMNMDWELWSCGTGDLENLKPTHHKIIHLGFLQPEDLAEIAKQTGVFILPSHFEPWGVVVHEFAAAGFPLICSDKVGSAHKFLKNEENGFTFSSGNSKELKKAMKKIILTSDSELSQMGKKSVEYASLITPETWSKNQIDLIDS